MSKVKKFFFNKEERIECLMTTIWEVETYSLAQARKLIEQGQGESIGLMFTESEVIEEGEVKYVEDK